MKQYDCRLCDQRMSLPDSAILISESGVYRLYRFPKTGEVHDLKEIKKMNHSERGHFRLHKKKRPDCKWCYPPLSPPPQPPRPVEEVITVLAEPTPALPEEPQPELQQQLQKLKFKWRIK